MTDPADELESYLVDLSELLRGLPREEVADILQELRTHVLDSPGGPDAASPEEIADALGRLGEPQELAPLYLADRLLVRVEHGGSSWLLLRSLGRWATVNVVGLLAFLGLVTGYLVAASVFIAAVVKPFVPEWVGLWRLPDGELSLHLGLVAAPPPGEELLGWWIVPIGLFFGGTVLWSAPEIARFVIRRFRRHPLDRE